MNSFHLLKYLNKAKIFVFLFTLLGTFFVYNYTTSNQSYTSRAIIQYKTLDETTGVLPNGMAVDTSEIYSSTVVQNVINDLGITNSMESIRSSTSVTEVISTDETQRKKALLDKGESYVYYPNKFLISFRASGMDRGGYVRDVLDATLQNYFEYYSEKYVEVAAMPNNAVDVVKDQYDYLESVELVAACTSEMIDFLNVKAKYDADFRASSTGYTFADLLGQYTLISDNTIPSLYATVLESRLSKNAKLLLIKYQNRIENCQGEIESMKQQMETLQDLMSTYSNHSKESLTYSFDNNTSAAIINNVNGNSKSEVQDTTYDSIITQYVDLDTKLREKETELAYNQEIVAIFDGSSDRFALSTGDITITESNLLAKLQDTVDELSRIYAIFEVTLKEYNAYIGASNITMLTSITVSEALNVKMYLVLAVLLFLFIGCAMSIVVGRTSEYMDYMLYVDKKTNLPNRIRCDSMIDHYGRGMLSEDFVLGIVNLDSLNDVNRLKGRAEGDAHLAAFSNILRLLSNAYGFIAYNGGNQFFCLFEHCSEDKMGLFRSVLQDKVDAYNTENGVSPLSFSLGMASSTLDNCHAVRKMILLARQRLYGGEKQPPKNDPPKPPTGGGAPAAPSQADKPESGSAPAPAVPADQAQAAAPVAEREAKPTSETDAASAATVENKTRQPAQEVTAAAETTESAAAQAELPAKQEATLPAQAACVTAPGSLAAATQAIENPQSSEPQHSSIWDKLRTVLLSRAGRTNRSAEQTLDEPTDVKPATPEGADKSGTTAEDRAETAQAESCVGTAEPEAEAAETAQISQTASPATRGKPAPKTTTAAKAHGSKKQRQKARPAKRR